MAETYAAEFLRTAAYTEIKNSEGKLRRKLETSMSMEENKARMCRLYEEIFKQ